MKRKASSSFGPVEQFIPDDVFARLLTVPNVLITGHQAFSTDEALTAIAETTIANVTSFERTGDPLHPCRGCRSKMLPFLPNLPK